MAEEVVFKPVADCVRDKWVSIVDVDVENGEEQERQFNLVRIKVGEQIFPLTNDQKAQLRGWFNGHYDRSWLKLRDSSPHYFLSRSLSQDVLCFAENAWTRDVVAHAQTELRGVVAQAQTNLAEKDAIIDQVRSDLVEVHRLALAQKEKELQQQQEQHAVALEALQAQLAEEEAKSAAYVSAQEQVQAAQQAALAEAAEESDRLQHALEEAQREREEALSAAAATAAADAQAQREAWQLQEGKSGRQQEQQLLELSVAADEEQNVAAVEEKKDAVEDQDEEEQRRLVRQLREQLQGGEDERLRAVVRMARASEGEVDITFFPPGLLLLLVWPLRSFARSFATFPSPSLRLRALSSVALQRITENCPSLSMALNGVLEFSHRVGTRELHDIRGGLLQSICTEEVTRGHLCKLVRTACIIFQPVSYSSHSPHVMNLRAVICRQRSTLVVVVSKIDDRGQYGDDEKLSEIAKIAEDKLGELGAGAGECEKLACLASLVVETLDELEPNQASPGTGEGVSLR
jgi:hypothetical protein